jgi:site-specific recombinase XerC
LQISIASPPKSAWFSYVTYECINGRHALPRPTTDVQWLLEEGEINRNPFERMRPPKVEETPVPVISKAELPALIKSLAGTSLEDQRDTAIVRLFLNTGARLEEMAQLQLSATRRRLSRAPTMGPRSSSHGRYPVRQREVALTSSTC